MERLAYENISSLTLSYSYYNLEILSKSWNTFTETWCSKVVQRLFKINSYCPNQKIVFGVLILKSWKITLTLLSTFYKGQLWHTVCMQENAHFRKEAQMLLLRNLEKNCKIVFELIEQWTKQSCLSFLTVLL